VQPVGEAISFEKTIEGEDNYGLHLVVIGFLPISLVSASR